MVAPRPLFRANALAGVSNLEAHGQVPAVVPPSGWIALLAVVMICAAALVWSILGTLSITVSGLGVLAREYGMTVDVYAPKMGWLDELVDIGARIRPGDVLARLAAPEEQARVADLELRLSQLRAQRANLEQRHGERMAAETRLAILRRAGLDEQIDLTTRRINELEELLRVREQLRSGGNSTVERVLETRERLYAAREALARARSDLRSVETGLLAILASHAQERDALERELRSVDGLLAQARLARDLNTEITAREAGEVVMIPVTRHALISAGQRIMTFESGGERLETLVYLPPEAGKQVRVGMFVRVSPGNARREEYGTIEGTVRWVSPVPQSQAEIADRLSNPELAKQLAKGQSAIAAIVTLGHGPDGAEYAWSSVRGQGVALSSGTPVTVDINLRRVAPIQFIIPLLRQWTGL